MSKSSKLGAGVLRDLFVLTNQCRELGDCPVAWREHLFKGLARLVDADLASGGEMVTVDGVPQIGFNVDWGELDRSALHRILSQLRNDLTPAGLHEVYFTHPQFGKCLSRTELVPDGEWYSSASFEAFFKGIGINHSLFCFQPIPGDPGTCSVITFNRAIHRKRDFTARDRLIVDEAAAMILPLLGGPLARAKEPTPCDLPPRARQVLQALLEGDTDKQIALRLNISPHTVNEYTKAIYRHFHVSGRSALLARWIRRAYPTGFHWDSSSGPPVQL